MQQWAAGQASKRGVGAGSAGCRTLAREVGRQVPGGSGAGVQAPGAGEPAPWLATVGEKSGGCCTPRRSLKILNLRPLCKSSTPSQNRPTATPQIEMALMVRRGRHNTLQARPTATFPAKIRADSSCSGSQGRRSSQQSTTHRTTNISRVSRPPHPRPDGWCALRFSIGSH